MTEALTVDRLGVDYHARGSGVYTALDDVSFSIGRGELVGVVGPNGAGKSTLFRAVCGLLQHRGGVSLGGRHCHHGANRPVAGFIPQRSDIDPNFPITVAELVMTGRRRHRSLFRRPRPADHQAVAQALADVRLVGREHDPIGTLSGGQLQRAMLARALAQGAQVLLLDESLSGVDAPTTADLFDLFDVLCATGTTILVATHDLSLARHRFTRCLAINRGLVADGPPEAILQGEILDATYGSGTLSVPVETVTR